jgi:hypothetical protein
VFSVFQLIGGLITGLILVNRLGKFQTFSLGCITWIIYEIGSAYIHNVTGYFAIHALNGLSYGIIYNLILGSVLQKVFSTKKQTPMGVYQSVLSIGIMCGT